MTALYFHALRAEDRIAVKPHAAPVLHAIQYMLGRQNREALQNFRALGGAQSYPSRTKDTTYVDFSTGSVGLGVAATLHLSSRLRWPCSMLSPATLRLRKPNTQLDPKPSIGCLRDRLDSRRSFFARISFAGRVIAAAATFRQRCRRSAKPRCCCPQSLCRAIDVADGGN